jgi:methionine--tRNA ligase beta chain
MVTKPEITYEDFAKLDLKVATIKEVEEIPEADKLYKLTLDDGEKERTIAAGIKQHYEKEDLVGKQIIIIANLAPRKLKGITSEGMLLAADENGKPTLLIPEEKVEEGSEIH